MPLLCLQRVQNSSPSVSQQTRDRFYQFLRFDRLGDMHPKSGSMGLLPIDLLHKTDVLRELVRGWERKIPKSTELS
jgi:hypothetical protein